MAQPVLSWGRSMRYTHDVRRIDRFDRAASDLYAQNKTTVFHGMGRSYGDVALNAQGALCHVRAADNLIEFDRTSGRLKAQSGMTFAELNALTVPEGWIVPVSPGTQHVTLGGAVANDVHGKNHHQAGSLGAHIQALKIIRSDGETLLCDRESNADFFAATISGLGLTGYIAWIEIQLIKISSSHLFVENLLIADLDEFLETSEASAGWPYTGAWIDGFSPKSKLGRGIFTRARFCEDGKLGEAKSGRQMGLPFELPTSGLNKVSISAFNWLFRHRPGAQSQGRQHYQRFFYPLDRISSWNQLYGRRGLYQHQAIIPFDRTREGLRELLSVIRTSGQGSFLAVMKRHGHETSPGWNSFPMDGVSLALDFPNRGEKTRRLLSKLNQIAVDYGGRIYPAKDATMSAEIYQTCYPNWLSLEALRDPKIDSSFWRRVTNRDV